MIHMRSFNSFEVRNLKFLTQKNIEYTLVQITETGYHKSILDATDPMRQYFKEIGMHDYAIQNKDRNTRCCKKRVYSTKQPYILLPPLCTVRKQKKETHVYGPKT